MTLFYIRCVNRVLVTQPNNFYVNNVKVVKTELSDFFTAIIAPIKTNSFETLRAHFEKVMGSLETGPIGSPKPQ